MFCLSESLVRDLSTLVQFRVFAPVSSYFVCSFVPLLLVVVKFFLLFPNKCWIKVAICCDTCYDVVTGGNTTSRKEEIVINSSHGNTPIDASNDHTYK